MSKKFDEQRRAAFLRAVAETGNQTVAAERAKVSRSWVHLHQSGDPAFRAAIDAAVAEARGTLAAGGAGTRPPRGWAIQDGARLVVRGTNGRRVQIARARLKQWDPAAEDRFLAVLAASCNVKAACADVGLTPASAYGHRKRWPAFAARWAAAVDEGYVRLEAALLESAGNLFSGEAAPDAAPLPQMTVDQAFQLLHMHKREVRGVGGQPGRVPRQRTLQELTPGLIRKADAILRHNEQPPHPLSDPARGAWRGREG